MPGAAQEVPVEAVIAALPFEPVPECNRIQLDLSVPGERPFRMLLDTGAAFSVLTPLAARALGVSVRRTKHDPDRRRTRLGRDLQFLVDTRSSDTGSKTGWEYGLLGGNLLESYVVELDFESAQVRFLDPDRFAVPEQPASVHETVVPIRLGTKRPTLDVEIEGRPLRVLLDTGAPWGLLLSGAAAREVGIDDPRKRLWLRQRRDESLLAGLAYEPMRVSGAVVLPLAGAAGGISVIGVRPDSPAARLGLLRGDTVLLASPGRGGRSTPAELLAALRDGEPLRIVRREGDVDAILDLPSGAADREPAGD